MTLEEWMKAQGLTDAALAAKVGCVSRSQITRIRNGRCTSPKTARALEQVTKIPAAAFVMGEAA